MHASRLLPWAHLNRVAAHDRTDRGSGNLRCPCHASVLCLSVLPRTGGLLVVLQPSPDVRRLGVMQGMAAGLMLCLSFFDLLPEAIDKIGFKLANLWVSIVEPS